MIIMSSNLDCIFGLSYIPMLESSAANLDDAGLYGISPLPSLHFDDDTVDWFTQSFLSIKDSANFILEIGVDEFKPGDTTKPTIQSSTEILINNKNSHTIYLGIDLQDKSYIDDVDNNIFTIKGNSTNHSIVEHFMEKHNINEIDFLFLDGDHSLNTVLQDWRYSEWVSVGGIIVLHDTHWHLGPKLLFDAVNDHYFDKTQYGNDRINWGLSILRRIQ